MNKKQIQSFLGLESYHRRYLPNLSELTLVLTELLKKGKKFMSSVEVDRAFVELKSRLASGPILRAPDF